MNKLELVETLKEETGITKNEASVIVNLFFDEMSAALASGDRVEIRGLCSFYVKHYKAYTGRNPKTGEQVNIKPKKLPFFKCGKELKDRVDY
ncbi:MAG: integration host factor subunit beta [Desulfobacterales bacterium]|nr:MAG: integration host factor subunit beta [Desulfobacterales bacterium]